MDDFQCVQCHGRFPLTQQFGGDVCIQCSRTQPRSVDTGMDEARMAQDAARLKQERVEEFNAQQAAAKEAAERELCRRRLLPFVVRVEPGYQPGWVHADICERLERFTAAIERGESPRLMIAMPPRHGKSALGSKTYPSWFLGRNPAMEVMICSYSGDLAKDFSRKCRGLLENDLYKSVFRKTRLAKDSKSVERWSTTASGALTAAGVGGPITGRGAHLAIIDDPVKNRDEAESEAVRQSIKDWYSSALYTRLAPGGGLLIIQCMTGDTPVLLPDGTERPLAELRPGDAVATFDEGVMSSSVVVNHHNNGRDAIYAITTSDGRVVRANARHPFLVENDDGELEWVRLKNLSTGSKIVTAKASGASGEGKPASGMAATSRSSAVATAARTTTRRSGRMGIAPPLLAPRATASDTSSIATGLQWRPMTPCLTSRAASALSADNLPAQITPAHTGMGNSASTIATTPDESVGCSATTATLPLDTQKLRPPLMPLRDTSDFTTATIATIEPCGYEDVYDVQIDRTENFIANGLVSHNTRWHSDDLSGWLLSELEEARREAFKEGIELPDDVDDWELVEYPAIAVEDEKYRRRGEALHEARYPLPALQRIKRNMIPRDWEALYQQRPVSDDGDYFTRNMFRFYKPGEAPPSETLRIYAAGDLAISTKQSADYSVFAVVGIDRQQNIWLLDLIRGRWNALGIIDRMFEIQQRYNPELFGIETGQIELTMEPFIQKAEEERGISLNYEKLRTRGVDKGTRARPLQGRMEQGRVYFPQPESVDWMPTLMNELLKFPLGVNDDIVDALAWIGQMIMLYGIQNQKQDTGETPMQKLIRRYAKASGAVGGQSAMSA